MLLLPALPGCLRGKGPVVLPERLERQVADRGDSALRTALRSGSPIPFAVLVRFDAPVFPYQAELLADAGAAPAESVGSSAIVVAAAREIPALLDSHSVRSILYLCPQSVLSRLHPSLELEILRRSESGAYESEFALDVRFAVPPGERERAAVLASGFRIVRSGATEWRVSGTLTLLPRLLSIGEIIYFEPASN